DLLTGAVDDDAPSNDACVASKAVLPEIVAQHHHRWSVGDVLRFTERAAERRVHPEYVQDVRRGDNPSCALRTGLARERDIAVLSPRGDVAEELMLLLIVEIFGGRQPGLVEICPPAPDERELAGTAIREGLEQHRADHGEDRAVGTDAEGKRDYSNEREGRGAPQGAHRMAQVRPESVHRRAPASDWCALVVAARISRDTRSMDSTRRRGIWLGPKAEALRRPVGGACHRAVLPAHFRCPYTYPRAHPVRTISGDERPTRSERYEFAQTISHSCTTWPDRRRGGVSKPGRKTGSRLDWYPWWRPGGCAGGRTADVRHRARCRATCLGGHVRRGGETRAGRNERGGTRDGRSELANGDGAVSGAAHRSAKGHAGTGTRAGDALGPDASGHARA